MPRVVASVLAVTLGVAVAVAVASCGDGDAKLLPGDAAREIRENLDSVQRLVDEGECIDAEGEALQVSDQVEGLEGIDTKLKQALQEGAVRLNEVVDTCEEETEETVEETLPTTTESAEQKAKQEEEKEKEQKEREKEEQKAEKEQEKEQEEEQAQEEPTLPPQAEGEAKGHDKGPPEEGESGVPVELRQVQPA